MAVSDVHGDSLVVQGQDAVGIYDTKLYQNYNDVSFGGSTTLTMLNSSGLSRRVLFKFTNMDTIGTDRTVDSMALDLYCTIQSGATIGVFELWKDWYEGVGDNVTESGAVDDNHWYHPDSAWTKELADSACDVGSQNRGNGTGADRKATAMASVTVAVASAWHRFRIDGDLARAWYGGAKQPYGVMLMESGTVGTTVLASSEYSQAPTGPK
jgi:hypothetical protein